MQELTMKGIQQKLQKSYFRCKKNTWHVECNCILQPPKYLIIIVNRFRYINNNITKDRYSIPMDITIVLDLNKFNLQTTIDHHGSSVYSGDYTLSTVVKINTHTYMYIYMYMYIYIYKMDCVCQRYHKECSTRTCTDDCYNCWKKSKLKSYVRPWFHG